MNIIQFWLIDSIVKASAQSASVALPTHATDPDQEPLFRGSLDDDEDDTHSHPHDIENPPARSRSRSPSKDGRVSPSEEEPKSSAATSVTAAASGSGTGTPKNVDENSLHTVVHAYPPSMASTSSSPASSRPSSVSPPKRRRSPPPPLVLQPQPQPAAPQPVAPDADRQEAVEHVHDEKEWAAWDENDDWADRVGEEDWTGKRLDARKAAVHETWTAEEQHPGTTRVS